MAYEQKKPLLPGRVALIGEEGIPRDTVEQLNDAHVQIFPREPDPENWPPELQPLVVFLSSEEKLGVLVSKVMDRYRGTFEEAFQPVLQEVCETVSNDCPDFRQDPDRIIDEMLKPMRRMLRTRMDGLVSRDR